MASELEPVPLVSSYALLFHLQLSLRQPSMILSVYSYKLAFGQPLST